MPAPISQSRAGAQMQTSDRPSRRDGIVTRWRQRPGVIAYAGTYRLLVVTGLYRFCGQRAAVVVHEPVPRRPRLCGHESIGTRCCKSQLGDAGVWLLHRPQSFYSWHSGQCPVAARRGERLHRFRHGVLRAGREAGHDGFGLQDYTRRVSDPADQSGESARVSSARPDSGIAARPRRTRSLRARRSLWTVIRREQVITRTGPACLG